MKTKPAARPKAGFTDYVVSDMSLAAFGRRELDLAFEEMPGLVNLIQRLPVIGRGWPHFMRPIWKSPARRWHRPSR